MRNVKIGVILVMICVCAVVAMMKAGDVKAERKLKEYSVDKIIQSVDENIDIEKQEGNGVNANEIMSGCSRALILRMKDGIFEFPKYVKPNKISVDPYDNIVLLYYDENEYVSQYEQLKNDSSILFVEEISVNDITLKDEYENDAATEGDVHNNYASDIMNTDIKVNEILEKENLKRVKIGFIDTGFYSIDSVPASYVNFLDSFDYYNGDAEVCDGIDSHATTVVSAFLDIVGGDIACNTDIVIGKCLENGTGSSYNVYLAIMDMSQKCDIINLSLGGSRDSGLLEYAINVAEKKGCIVICAAGNEASAVSYPACFKYSIAVSAIDQNKRKAYFTNYGPEIDYCAPGVNLVVDGPEYSKKLVNGTSFSAPIMTAVCQLAILSNDNIRTTDDIMKYLNSNIEDLGDNGKDNVYGYGMVMFRESGKPEEPTTSMPEEPTTSMPEEPTTSKPEKPTTGKPEEPTTRKPEESTTSTPEKPPTSKPEEPTPGKPEEPTTESPVVIPQPSKKVAKVEGARYSGTNYVNRIYSYYIFNRVEEAAYYEVYRCDYHGEELSKVDGLNWKRIGTTINTEYDDYDISVDKVYLIKIRAIDSEGNYGQFSEVFEVNNYRYDPKVTIETSAGSASISWTPYESVNLTGYAIYLYEENEKIPDIIRISKDLTSYRINNLVKGKKYRVLILGCKDEIVSGRKESMWGTCGSSLEFTAK